MTRAIRLLKASKLSTHLFRKLKAAGISAKEMEDAVRKAKRQVRKSDS